MSYKNYTDLIGFSYVNLAQSMGNLSRTFLDGYLDIGALREEILIHGCCGDDLNIDRVQNQFHFVDESLEAVSI